eukprot:4369103-Amphidinium_carterae.1
MKQLSWIGRENAIQKERLQSELRDERTKTRQMRHRMQQHRHTQDEQFFLEASRTALELEEVIHWRQRFTLYERFWAKLLTVLLASMPLLHPRVAAATIYPCVSILSHSLSLQVSCSNTSHVPLQLHRPLVAKVFCS